jgi:hypothetical protein
MPNDHHRNNDLDDITGRRGQIISPRDAQTGLPAGVRASETPETASATDRTFGDIEFDVVSPSLGDTATHEIGHVLLVRRGHDVGVENDETHLDEHSGKPGSELSHVVAEETEFQALPELDANPEPQSLKEIFISSALDDGLGDAGAIYSSNPGGGLLGAMDGADTGDALCTNEVLPEIE